MKRLAFSLTAALAVTAGADTLVHYHLNELEPGTRATAATVFSNAVNSGTLGGLPVTFNGADKTESNWLYPLGTNGLPAAWRYYDPVKNTWSEAGKALFVTFNNSGQYNWGAGISVPSVGHSSFTVETFFLYADRWGEKKQIWQTLFYKKGASGTALTALINEGHLCVYVGSKAVVSNYGSYDDAQWHHIACAYDHDARKLKVYMDYKLVKEVTLDEGVTLAAGTETFYAGLRGADGGTGFATFTGSLAEFRLSDTVLTPAQFIRAEKGDGSTLAWIAPGVAADPVPVYSQPDLSHSTYTPSEDIDGATLYDGAFDATGVAGRKSFAFGGESNAGGFVITDAERTFAVNSFTAEIGFKFPKNAWKDFTEDCVYLFCHSSQWYVRCMRADGRIDIHDPMFNRVATIPASAWDDAAWHRLAVVSDRENAETRVYLDGKLMARAASVLGDATKIRSDKIYVNCGCWNRYTAYSCKSGNLNDIRLTRKALKPSEFLTTKRVEGATLVWAPFDTTTDLLAAYVETPVFTGEAAVVRPCAGQLLDADKNPLSERPENKGSLSLAEGAAAYSRLSLLERPDQTVEFFVRGKASADTDLIALLGVKGTETNTVWALRQTGDGLKVVVGGDTTVSAGSLGSDWSHVGIVFAPSADNAKTTVTVYRDYKVVEAKEVDGLLSVDNLSDSVLSFGQFDGNLDELRVSRGSLGVKDFLRARRPGFALIVR